MILLAVGASSACRSAKALVWVWDLLVTSLIHLALMREFSGRLFSFSVARMKSSSVICVRIGKYSITTGKALLRNDTVGPSLFVSAVLFIDFLSHVASESLSISTIRPPLRKSVTARTPPLGVVSSEMSIMASLINLTMSACGVSEGNIFPPGSGSRMI